MTWFKFIINHLNSVVLNSCEGGKLNRGGGGAEGGITPYIVYGTDVPLE